MFDPTELPYYKDPLDLPTPLPTTSEIENAVATLPSIRDASCGRVVVVKEHYVVKYGTHVSENEGNALLFVERNLSVPAPRLYAMFREEGKLYLVMQFMRGASLQELWTHLSEDAKVSISRQLRRICDQMRSLPSPGYFGSVTKEITGPFDAENGSHSALALRSQQNWQDNNRRGWISEFFARNLPVALKDHASTFTHSDLYRDNILVDEIAAEEQHGEGQFVVSAIVDWETAGWHPSYWEYAASFVDFQWGDDWPEKYELLVDPWPLEAAMLKMVRQDLDY